MFTERVSVRDFESPHFRSQLVERLGWAVGDAQVAERTRSERQPSARVAARVVTTASYTPAP